MTFYRLADLLGAPSRDRQEKSPLTAIIENASIRAVLEDAPGRLEAVSSHPSTQQSLRWTFQQLSRAPASTVERLAGRGGLTGEVADLYRRFQVCTENYYHGEDLALSAAEAVRNEPLLGSENVGFTVFFQPRELTPGERELIEALAAAGRCAVFLGLTGGGGDGQAYRANWPAICAAAWESRSPSVPLNHQEIPGWLSRRTRTRKYAG